MKRTTSSRGASLPKSNSRAASFTALLSCLAALASAADFDTGAPPLDETTFSIGVYRMIVDTNNTWWPLLTGYPGFIASRKTLTGPICYDGGTMLGRSQPHPHANAIFTTGIAVGVGPSTIIKVGDYAS